MKKNNKIFTIISTVVFIFILVGISLIISVDNITCSFPNKEEYKISVNNINKKVTVQVTDSSNPNNLVVGKYSIQLNSEEYKRIKEELNNKEQHRIVCSNIVNMVKK